MEVKVDKIATHNSPAWIDKSNFIIRADLSNHNMAGRLEQLWARKLDGTVFEICCIPFFTYGIALGDKVETDNEYTVQRVTEKAGHKTLRIAVAKKNKAAKLHEILHEWVEKKELTYEWYAVGYLAVDVTPNTHLPIDDPVLRELSESGDISVEVDQ